MIDISNSIYNEIYIKNFNFNNNYHKGIFAIEFNKKKEVLFTCLIFIAFIVSILNPLSWLTYSIIYKMGTNAGYMKPFVKKFSQLFAFLISIISYFIMFTLILFFNYILN